MEGLLYVSTYPFHKKATFKCRTGSQNKTRLPKLFKPTSGKDERVGLNGSIEGGNLQFSMLATTCL